MFNLSLHPHYGYRALALSTSVGAAVNLLVLLVVFLRRYGGLLQRELILGLLRMAMAAAVMGLVLWELAPLFLGVVGLVFLIGVGGTVYVGLCALMRVLEVQDLLGVVRRRLPRRLTGR
jgi:putative peptidoglycan lipid II flippase